MAPVLIKVGRTVIVPQVFATKRYLSTRKQNRSFSRTPFSDTVRSQFIHSKAQPMFARKVCSRKALFASAGGEDAFNLFYAFVKVAFAS